MRKKIAVDLKNEVSVIGKYTIRKSGDLTSIDYKKSANDWFELAITTVFGLGPLIYVAAFIHKNGLSEFLMKEYTVHTISKSLLTIAFFIGLLGLGSFFTYAVVQELFEPVKNLFQIDQQQRRLTVRMPFYRSKTFSFAEIENFNLYNSLKVYRKHRNFKTSFCELYIQIKGMPEIRLHIFDMSKMRFQDQEKGIRETIQVGKQMSGIIAKECESTYNYYPKRGKH